MAKRNGWKKFFEKLNNLPNWIAILAVIATFLLGPLAFSAIVTEKGQNIYATVATIMCIPPFLYTVFLVIYSGRKLGISIYKAADKYKFTRSLFKSYEFRSIFFGICTFVCNVGYTIFLCVFAIIYKSPWYGSSAVYYILLSTARGGMLIQNAREEKKYKDDPLALARAKVGTYRYCGIMMITLTLALALSVVQMFADGASFPIPKWAVIPFAIVALYRIVMSILHFVKATKKDDLVVRAIRYINLGTALVSVLTCQTAIFVAFKPPFNPSYANAITGIIVCIIILALGIFMVTFSHEIKKKIKAKQVEAMKEAQTLRGYNREEYSEEYGLDSIDEMIEKGLDAEIMKDLTEESAENVENQRE